MTEKNKNYIEKFWDERESLNINDKLLINTVKNVLDSLDNGKIRVCEKKMEFGKRMDQEQFFYLLK